MTKKYYIIVSLICIFSLLLFVGTGLAAGGGGGSGSGSGSGDSEGAPLSLVSSTPAAGAKNVAVDSQIKLTFSKNVVNMAVKDNNLKCFSLLDAKGQAVAIDVKMADDQIEADKKNDVILIPRQTLNGGEQYSVVVSKDLTAKNGTKMDKETKVTFSTVGKTGNVLLNPAVDVAMIAAAIVTVYLVRRRAK